MHTRQPGLQNVYLVYKGSGYLFKAPAVLLLGYCGVVAKNDPAQFNRPTIILYETRNHQQGTPILVETDKTTGLRLS
jgi:hypothetical protein